MGLSIRAYARHRGVTDTAVHKAIRSGRIEALADGTIDPDQADAQWARNASAPKTGTQRPTVKVKVPEADGGEGERSGAGAATNSGSGGAGGGSEKSGARAVAQDLVAVFPIGMEVSAPKDGFLAMPWQSAISMQYQVLLVCENLETFLQLREYLWLRDLIKGRPTLGLFRGMVHTFGTDGAARLIANDHRPTLAFFDFDPRGLAMAASLPRREALCLPPWDLLEPAVHEARRDHLFTNSYHGSRVQLDKEQDSEIALAWQRLKLLTKGLNQEAFPRGDTRD